MAGGLGRDGGGRCGNGCRLGSGNHGVARTGIGRTRSDAGRLSTIAGVDDELAMIA